MHTLGRNVKGRVCNACVCVSGGGWSHSERKEGEKEPNVRMAEALGGAGGVSCLVTSQRGGLEYGSDP